jgi:hypothetical protein
MSQNPYAPPTAPLDPRPAAAASRPDQPWFAVGTRKLFVMSLVTFGLYCVYWFERQFRYQKRARGDSTIPFLRALFSIFFVHELFRRVEVAAGRADCGYGRRGGTLASVYVGATLLSAIQNMGDDLRTRSHELRFVVAGGSTLTILVFIFALTYPLFRVQGTVNDLLDLTEPDRDRNETLTAWNWPVVIVGGLTLLLVLTAAFLS